MVRRILLLVIYLGSLVGCVPTHHFKNNIPYYKNESANKGGLDQMGYYLRTLSFDSEKVKYYQPFFLDKKGLVLSYQIKDSVFNDFERHLEDEVKKQQTSRIGVWGAYLLSNDTLRMQIISYNSKYNPFVRIPILEHVFYKNGDHLIYEYSIDINSHNKSKHFRIKDFELEFRDFPLRPDIAVMLE